MRVRPMRLEDVPVVATIDRVSFPTPWSESTYRQELRENSAAYLYVAECLEDQDSQADILGYVGFWFTMDEVHISTIAVDPSRRGRGFGKLILKYALGQANRLGAELATLEVRESNKVAIEMYRKFGFVSRGRRRGYYRDNNEDALIMFKDHLENFEQEVRESIGEC
ncbi:MAG: ribosomal-protein-alanine N-acetyltransferase [Anaerolineales bacterium]|nr:MAG: ribosomal-protein-alanine N-acetyltransferase [Anaerolineales bacterium]